VSTANASVNRLQRDEVTGHVPSTREEVLARRERRKDEFGGRFDEYKTQLDDHKSGRRRLQEADADRLQRKVKSYERKLEQLHQEFDDRVRTVQ
jgi:hypothetical protein